MRTQDHISTPSGTTRHLIDELNVVFSRIVGEIDRSTRYCSSCTVEACPLVIRLEHIPVRKDIEVLGEETVVCVAKDMPRV